MNEKPLVEKITAFIAGRAQPKLEAFDKKAEKERQTVAGKSEQVIAEVEARLATERQELEGKYSTANRIADTAKRAGQRQLVTHPLKFTHPDAKGTSVFSVSYSCQQEECKVDFVVCTATLRNPVIDSDGNAAALDIMSFLQLQHGRKTVLDYIEANDPALLRPFAKDDAQAADWLADFREILNSNSLSSHKYAKQVYFPLEGGGYHLLSPLFPSSLSHAIHERITVSRFSDEAKAARKARRESRYHEQVVMEFPATAVVHHGGSNQQNISQLNKSRGGRTFLFSCAPPVWRKIDRSPIAATSIFAYGYFEKRVYRDVAFLRNYLEQRQDAASTKMMRETREELVDKLIDQLVCYGAEIQQMKEQAGWSGLPECRLSQAERLWLDPYRCEMDMEFKRERDGRDWQVDLADKFAFWLNKRLSVSKLTLGDSEYQEWKSLLERKMRLLKEDLEDFS